MNTINKEYLGDSVHVSCNGYMITLTTEDGLGPSNTIHIEEEVLESLVNVRIMDQDD